MFRRLCYWGWLIDTMYKSYCTDKCVASHLVHVMRPYGNPFDCLHPHCRGLMNSNQTCVRSTIDSQITEIHNTTTTTIKHGAASKRPFNRQSPTISTTRRGIRMLAASLESFDSFVGSVDTQYFDKLSIIPRLLPSSL